VLDSHGADRYRSLVPNAAGKTNILDAGSFAVGPGRGLRPVERIGYDTRQRPLGGNHRNLFTA